MVNKLQPDVVTNSKAGIFETRLPFYVEFIIAFGILLAARASLIFPLNYSSDDYGWGFIDIKGVYHLFAQEGRLILYFFNKIVDYLGSDFPFLGAFWPISACGAYTIFGFALRNLWMKKSPSFPAIIMVLIFSTFPYHNELIIFHIALPAVFMCLISSSISFYFIKGQNQSMIFATLLMIVAFSYQLFIPYIAIACLISLLVELCKNLDNFKINHSSVKVAMSRILSYFGPLLIAVVCSLILAKVTTLFSGVEPSSRMQMASLYDAPDKAIILMKQLQYFLLRTEIMMPLAFKVLQVTLISIFIWQAYKKIQKSSAKKTQSVSLIIIVFICVGAAFACNVVPYLFIKDSMAHMSMRALSGFSVFWSGIFALAWIVSDVKLRKIVVVLGALLVSGYCMKTSQYSVDFARLNMREKLFGNRVIERISLLPTFEKVRTVVFVGLGSEYLMEDLETPLKTSFFYSYNAVAVLSELSGRLFEKPTIFDVEKAKQLSANMPAWPHAESVIIDTDIVIINISR